LAACHSIPIAVRRSVDGALSRTTPQLSRCSPHGARVFRRTHRHSIAMGVPPCQDPLLLAASFPRGEGTYYSSHPSLSRGYSRHHLARVSALSSTPPIQRLRPKREPRAQDHLPRLPRNTTLSVGSNTMTVPPPRRPLATSPQTRHPHLETCPNTPTRCLPTSDSRSVTALGAPSPIRHGVSASR